MKNEPLLSVRGLSKRYVRGRWTSRGQPPIRALEGVDLEILPGVAVALVGESGSGKTTLARCLSLLERPDEGSIRYRRRDLLALSRRGLLPFRRKIQLIFQDPATALNPRFSAAEIVGEPLRIQERLKARERRSRALEAMGQVGLLARWADRRPPELSGGQRQRLAIARALVQKPRLLILDEALSALDLSVQAQIGNLLLDLQDRLSLTYLYISHDLAVVKHLADEVVVLRRGRIVENGPTAEVFRRPRHAHTRELLAATPTPGWIS